MKKNCVFVFTVLVFFLILTSGSVLSQDNYRQGNDKIIAEIGDTKIMLSEFNEIMKRVPSQFKSRLSTFEGKKELLSQLIEIKLFAKQARDIKIDKNPEVKIKLKESKDQILAMEYIEHLKNEIKLKDEELKNYYEKNKNRYYQQEEINVSHILVKTKKEANEIQKELKQGRDFAQLAREHSTCPSKNNGGNLGWFGHGKMVPEFDKAAFDLKKGEISDSVKTNFGYHIIRVEGIKNAGQMSFADVKEKLIKQLTEEKAEVMIADSKAELNKKFNVKIFEDVLK